jgi:tRNA threonylcarbamoyl adenosine modification protein (Sua5/YciO/YrdC/YwlC family)
MPELINFDEINKADIVRRIKAGEIFIYPTDTIYGLGCNALKQGAVQLIKEIKRRDDKPLSVIAPNKQWINKNLEVNNKHFVRKLPGPYTYIMKIKKRGVARNVNPGLKTLGVRIPNHPFTDLIKKAGVPFITTSVNLSGRAPVRDLSKVPKSILKRVDVVVDDGFLHNYPSTLIDLTGEIPKIIRR